MEILELYRLWRNFDVKLVTLITNLTLYYAFTYIVQCRYHEKRLISVLPIQISVTYVLNKRISRAKTEKNTSGSKDSG